ncbi:acyl transferase/acyl hydrolase/lysophospholipase [Podospora conica]|nr:acyl transferase/acyl hydrolase/lysophospholipase [Schizothecium conicum]
MSVIPWSEGQPTDPPRDLKLLCFDGGGVRGLSSLYILQELMKQVADDPNHPPKPCHWFHMIGGTSTGGLIAIMLGRLQMSVRDCIDAYTRMMGSIFTKSRPVFNIPFSFRTNIRARFNTAELERAIKEIVADAGYEDALLRDPGCHGESKVCKVFVCATEYETADIHLFSNYRLSRRGSAFDDIYEGALIWEACRATSAASTFFDPVTIGADPKMGKSGMVFLDGATKANNPVNKLWEEAAAVFGDDFEKRLQLAVSIGTGVPQLRAFGRNLRGVAKTMVKLSTETEDTDGDFQRANRDLVKDERFFRFNVDGGLADVGLERADKQARIRAATHRYLESMNVQRRLNVFKMRAIAGELTEPAVVLLPLPLTRSPPERAPKLGHFLRLDASSTHVKRNPKYNKSYWARITHQAWKVYEQCYAEAAGDNNTDSVILFEQYHWYLARFAGNFPSITAELIWEIWCRLRTVGNPEVAQALPKPLAMAALCMAHLEGIVDPHTKPRLEEVRCRGGPKRLSDKRLKFLRLFDKWVNCACGCGAKWNFVSDPPDALRDDTRMNGSNCLAVGGGAKKKGLVSMFKKETDGSRLALGAVQQKNLRAWYALDLAG